MPWRRFVACSAWLLLLPAAAAAQNPVDASRLYLGVRPSLVVRHQTGSGSPEGVVTAPVNTQYVDVTTGLKWRKATGSGNTGWTVEISLTPCGSAGQFARSTGSAWGCSTLVLPNGIVSGYIPYATGTDTIGSSSGLTYNGSTFGVAGGGTFTSLVRITADGSSNALRIRGRSGASNDAGFYFYDNADTTQLGYFYVSDAGGGTFTIQASTGWLVMNAMASTFNKPVFAPAFRMGASPTDVGMRVGTAGDSYITWDGGTLYPQGFRFQYGGSSAVAVEIESGGYVGVGTTDALTTLHVSSPNQALGASYNAGRGNVFITSSDAAAAINKGGTLSLGGTGRTSGPFEIFNFATVSGRKETATSGDPAGYLAFETASGVTNLLTERMRITSTGAVGIGTSAPAARLHVINTGEVARFGYDAGNYASFSMGSGGALTVAPTGDLVLDPVGNDILPAVGNDINYGSLALKNHEAHFSELWVQTLVAQDTLAVTGGRQLVGTTTVLEADVADTAGTTGTTGGMLLKSAGVTNSDVACMVDGVLDQSCFHTDTGTTGEYIRADYGAGNEKLVTMARVYATGSSAAVWRLDRSDNDIDWTAVCTLPALVAGWNQCYTTGSMSTHRYWRLYLTNTPGAGAWSGEIEFIAEFQVYVKHNSLTAGTAGDVVYMESSGKVEFFHVNEGPTGAGPYLYYVTRNLDGGGRNAWYAGDAVFDTGSTGDGFIDLYSVRGVKAGTELGPAIVGNVRLSLAYNDWAPRWALGNLDGTYGYSTTTYGAAFGVPGGARVTVDATNGIRMYDGLNNARVTITPAGAATFSGDGGSVTNINGGNIQTDTVTAAQIAADAITASELAADSVTSAKIVAATIVSADIAAATITGGNIAAGTITADRMNVSTLAAIVADLGTITAGSVTVGTNGYVRQGQTAYATGTGFWLGDVAGVPKLSIGSSTRYFTWDGSLLSVVVDNLWTGQNASANGQVKFWSANTAVLGGSPQPDAYVGIGPTNDKLFLYNGYSGGVEIYAGAGNITLSGATVSGFRHLVADNGSTAGQMPTVFADGGIKTIVDSDTTTATLAGFFAFKSAQNQTGGPQALEGYTYMSQTGTTTLGIALIGNIEHAGTGTTTTMRAVQAGVILSNTGGGTTAVAYEAAMTGRVASTGTYTNGIAFSVGTFGAGFTNKYSLYSTDSSALLHNAGTVRSDTGFNVNGTAGMTRVCNPTAGNMTFSGGLLTDCTAANPLESFAHLAPVVNPIWAELTHLRSEVARLQLLIGGGR